MYSATIQAYSDILRTLPNPSIFRTLVYSETLNIQNQRHTWNRGIFRTLAISKPEAYSEPCEVSTVERFAKVVNDYNYFPNISISLSLLYEVNIMNFLNTCIILTPKVYQM